jgi:hypothetical protein
MCEGQKAPPFCILVYFGEISYALILYGDIWRGTHTGLVLRNHSTRITVLNVLLAGRDTTACCVSWTFYV